MTTKTRSRTRSSSKAKDTDALSLIPVESDNPPIDNAVGYELDKPVNLAQLTDEIETATGTSGVVLAQLGPNGPGPVSPDNPAQLWLLPASLDPEALAEVIAAHVINPDWGVPQVLKDFSTAMAKLQADPESTLTDSDKDALLRGLALQFNAMIISSQGSPNAPST